jgi:plasmid stabilization system protein ParE
MRVVVSEQADADLLQIFQYLAQRNPDAAEAVLRDIDRKFENLSHFFRLLAGRDPVSPAAFEASSRTSM